MNLSVKLVKNSLPDAIRQFPLEVDKLLSRSIYRLHSFALNEAPYRSGALMRGHYVLRINNGYQLKVRDVPYAGMVFFGTKPHLIQPKNPKGFLVFPGRGGKMMFTKLVRHPGTKPNKWLDRAAAREKPHFENDVKRLAEYIEHL